MNEIRTRLAEAGLKVTPQRVAVLEAVILLKNHPSAEGVIDFIREHHPNIATATVYKILDALVENNLIKRVKTERGIMRYDAVMESHHHLYCSDSERIEDYSDNDLTILLNDYFKKKEIPGFRVEDIKLHIIGKFTKQK